MIAKRSSRGRVKTCCVHDLLHDFCLVKAEEEGFLSRINMYDELPIFRISQMHEQYRLCVRSGVIPSVGKGPFKSRVRTLLFSNSIPGRSSSKNGDSYSIPKRLLKRFLRSRILSRRLTAAEKDTFSIPKRLIRSWLLFGSPHVSAIDDRDDQDHSLRSVMGKFKLLRVLDLGSFEIGDENVFESISGLVHLRYIYIAASIIVFPAQVTKLKNLETFLLRSTLVNLLSPETIWNMAKLRHFHIIPYGFEFLIDSPNSFEDLPQMESLTTLSTPSLCCGKDIEKIMSSLPNLRKLKCEFLDLWDPVKSCNNFPVLDFLNRLESLKVFFSGKGLYPCNLSFPSSIKKLTLIRSCLPWNEISIIGRLPNLEVLKLLSRAFEGPEWNLKDGEFQQLKYLKLVSLDLAIWNASGEHLPQLEQLLLKNCHYLKEVPSVLGEILTLKRIDMISCNPAAMDSVVKIKEEQHVMGNDQFNVFISRNWYFK